MTSIEIKRGNDTNPDEELRKFLLQEMFKQEIFYLNGSTLYSESYAAYLNLQLSTNNIFTAAPDFKALTNHYDFR